MDTSALSANQKTPGLYPSFRLHQRISQTLVISLILLSLLLGGDGNGFSGKRDDVLQPALADSLSTACDFIKNIADDFAEDVVACHPAEGAGFDIIFVRLCLYFGPTVYLSQHIANDSLHPRPPPSVRPGFVRTCRGAERYSPCFSSYL